MAAAIPMTGRAPQTQASALSRRRRPGLRNLIVPLAIVCVAIALALVALRDEPLGTLNVDVHVLSTTDPSEIGATTRAKVELVNRDDREVRPRFSLTWLPYPYYWRILSGQPVLAPGERATYEIEAPDSVAAPARGEPFQIRVNNADSITYAVSPPIELEKPKLPMVNPMLRFWSKNFSSGIPMPVGWQVYERKGDGDRLAIAPASVFGVDATHLRVEQDGNPDPGGWSHGGLTQEGLFPSAPFDIRVLSRAPYASTPGGWPLNAFGMEVTDEHNGLMWLLFQPTGTGDVEYDLPSGHHIKVFDVPEGEWAVLTIDLPALYHKLNWPPSKKVTLKLFIAASSSQATDIDGYIAGMKLTTDTAGRTSSTTAH